MFDTSANTHDQKEKRFDEAHKDDGLDSLSDVLRRSEFCCNALNTTSTECASVDYLRVARDRLLNAGKRRRRFYEGTLAIGILIPTCFL